jgi:ppGpp synthetase/RelA/SpoT-type nucleotidyltranferase
VVLEKYGEDKLDHVSSEAVLHRVKEERNILHTIRRRKVKLDWAHIA